MNTIPKVLVAWRSGLQAGFPDTCHSLEGVSHEPALWGWVKSVEDCLSADSVLKWPCCDVVFLGYQRKPVSDVPIIHNLSFSLEMALWLAPNNIVTWFCIGWEEPTSSTLLFSQQMWVHLSWNKQAFQQSANKHCYNKNNWPNTHFLPIYEPHKYTQPRHHTAVYWECIYIKWKEAWDVIKKKTVMSQTTVDHMAAFLMGVLCSLLALDDFFMLCCSAGSDRSRHCRTH